MMIIGNPDDVTGSTAFDLQYSDNTGSRAATIFSNGRNQVPVTVRTVLLNNKLQVVNLSDTQLWECLTLKTTRGEIIEKRAPDPAYQKMSVWNVAGDYAHAVKYSFPATCEDAMLAASDDDYSRLTVYVSTGMAGGDREFYAELNFKHFHETTEGGEGAGHYLSHLIVNTLQGINYSDINKWQIIKQNESEKQYFPGIPGLSDAYFLAQEFRLYWKSSEFYPFHSIQEQGDTFKGGRIGKAFFSVSRPISALMSKGGNNFDINAWTVMSRPYDVYGPNVGFRTPLWFYVYSGFTEQTLLCDVKDAHQVFDQSTPPYNYISVYRVQIHCPGGRNFDLHAKLWEDYNKRSRIEVTDIYGNPGIIPVNYKYDSWEPILG